MINNREKLWIPEYSRVPSVTWHSAVEVTLHDIRNFHYSTEERVAPGWYDRRFTIHDVKSADLILSYWGGNHIAHVFLSFELNNANRIAFSVETRRHVGQPWSVWRGFFRAYPLIYVAGDERDLIGQRLCTRRERVYLYPMSLSAAFASSLMTDYLKRIDHISKNPERYHTFCNNCTTNILRHGKSLSPDIHYNWQVFLSGHSDRYCYTRGLLLETLPPNTPDAFNRLKIQSRLIPPASITPDFSWEIRSHASHIVSSR